jgi:hypothetical protein
MRPRGDETKGGETRWHPTSVAKVSLILAIVTT